MKSSTLVFIRGPDSQSFTTPFMRELEKSKIKIEDIGYSITHGQASLSLLISNQKSIIQELKRLALSLGHEFEQSDPDLLLQVPQVHRFVLSSASICSITPAYLADIADIFKKNNIKICRIENRSPSTFHSVDINATSETEVDLQKLKFELMDLSNKHTIDSAFMEDDLFRYNKRLIVFDMDSTLIQGEVIDEMARVHGIGDEVKLITKRAMNGELSFDESLRQRVLLLKGFPAHKMDEVHHSLDLTPGAEKLITTVRKLGFKTAIVSGGFMYFAEKLRHRLGIDYVFANELDWDQDVLSGQVNGQIINAEQKAVILENLAEKENIFLEQVVAVGDGANDLLMLAKAGLGIAFHAKEKVRNESRHQMSHGPMSTILYFLGIPGNHYL